MEIKVVDSIMGTGKTQSLINHINKTDDDTKFLYITPYLSEVERIIDSCSQKRFKQPPRLGTKLNGIKELFEKGVNIVSTHSLFRLFDNEIIDLAFNNNYVLIMDEVADVIEPLEISKYDLDTLLEKYTEVQEGHLLKWTSDEYEGEFEKYKKLCDLECVGIYNNTAILWLFPISVFRAFKEIYILTYMFKSQTQKYYFDLYHINYQYLYVKGDSPNNYTLTNEKIITDKTKYTMLIDILDNDKLNHIGEMDSALSKSWYLRNKDNVLLTILKNNVYNFFKNHTKTKTQLNLWTTFKDFQGLISGKGYSKGYLSSNMRATNNYRDRVSVSYLVNKYFNPHIKNFFVENGIDVDEDGFALSEMLQFLFRSAIREEKKIKLYCPSKRMRGLLEYWIHSDD